VLTLVKPWEQVLGKALLLRRGKERRRKAFSHLGFGSKMKEVPSRDKTSSSSLGGRRIERLRQKARR